MLKETHLFGKTDRVATALTRIREFEPVALNLHPDGYWVAFSGGKDSIVLLDLVRRAGVAHTAHFSLTTVDPPELLEFVREHYPTVERRRPPIGMFGLIVKNKIPPTRTMRSPGSRRSLLTSHAGSDIFRPFPLISTGMY